MLVRLPSVVAIDIPEVKCLQKVYKQLNPSY